MSNPRALFWYRSQLLCNPLVTGVGDTRIELKGKEPWIERHEASAAERHLLFALTTQHYLTTHELSQQEGVTMVRWPYIFSHRRHVKVGQLSPSITIGTATR